MRCIIAGTREIEDYKLVCSAIERSCFEITEVVSGGCRGPDKLGERWAREHNIPIKHFYAQWKKFGKRAGPIRNIEMVEYSDAAIFIWDGESKGTEHCMNVASESDIKIFIYRIPLPNKED